MLTMQLFLIPTVPVTKKMPKMYKKAHKYLFVSQIIGSDTFCVRSSKWVFCRTETCCHQPHWLI